ncbi:MAG: alpha/beta hydrolase [Actinomycetota bacterium]
MADIDPDAAPVPLWKELRAPAELGVFLGLAPLWRAMPAAPARTVLVVPGFGTDDRATAPLRTALRRLGHRPRRWAQGRNGGPTPERIEGLTRRLRALADEAGEPIPIVGWSLGGVYGRVMAQWHRELVDQVISLGSPFNLGDRSGGFVTDLYSRAEAEGRFVRRRGEVDLDVIERPSTSIYTRSDGIVPWRACVQTPSATAENVEVRGSHCGLGVNLSAAYVVADRLRFRGGDWQPFRPPPLLRPLYRGAPCAN